MIELEATDIRIDGQLLSEGKPGSGARAGGGAGGSIKIRCKNFRGDGTLSVRGGNVAAGTTTCRGGGGGGGRVAIYYSQSFFDGEVQVNGGGNGYECGGSGTVIWKDENEIGFRLQVDNKDTCEPLQTAIDFGILSDTHRGEHSFHTWLYDPLGGHNHVFLAVSIFGGAHLALHRRNIDDFTQRIQIKRTGNARLVLKNCTQMI